VRRAAALVAALAAATACTHGSTVVRGASRGSPAIATADEVPVCGFAVEVTVRHGVGVEPSRAVEGELVAATGEELWVLGDGGLVRIPAADATVRLSILPSSAPALGLLTALGSISTLSHGFYLVFSLPIWLGAGIASTSRASSRSFAVADGADPELAAWARFPQGRPPGWPEPGTTPGRCLNPSSFARGASSPDGAAERVDPAAAR
jgi:hypothetical protein